MTWYAWVVVSLMALGCLANIRSVDKPRKPTTAEGAILVCIVNGLMIWAVFALAGTA